MCSFSFDLSTSSFVYALGVNAANLTSKDIANANAKLRPQLKVTQGDAGKNSTAQSACGVSGATLSQYSSWTRKELCKAVVDRRIKSGKAVARMSSWTKIQLIDTLRKADKNPKFSRFTDLPAEIRNEVYKLAIADVVVERTKFRVRPESPNICRVNKQTRTESLPLFLRSIHQTIIVTVVPAGPKAHHLRRAVICDEYYDWFKEVHKFGWLQHMRSFHFRLKDHTPRHNGKTKIDENARYSVKFAKNMESVKMWRREKKDKNGRLQRAKDDLLPKIKAGMATTRLPGNSTMTTREFDSMIKIFLETVNLHCAE